MAHPAQARSGAAPHALSGVEVFCAEKDSGFFAALRMTQEKGAPARVRPTPDAGAPVEILRYSSIRSERHERRGARGVKKNAPDIVMPGALGSTLPPC